MLGFHKTMTFDEVREFYADEEYDVSERSLPSGEYFQLKNPYCPFSYLVPQTWRLNEFGVPLDPRYQIELPVTEELLPSLNKYIHCRTTATSLEFGILHSATQLELTDLEVATHFTLTCYTDYAKSGDFELSDTELEQLGAIQHYCYEPIGGLYDQYDVFLLPIPDDDAAQCFCLEQSAKQQQQRLENTQKFHLYRETIIPAAKPSFELLEPIITDGGKYPCVYGDYWLTTNNSQGKPTMYFYTESELIRLLKRPL